MSAMNDTSNDRKSQILDEILRHVSAIETLKRELDSLGKRPRDTGLFKKGGLTREQFRAGIRALGDRR